MSCAGAPAQLFTHRARLMRDGAFVSCLSLLVFPLYPSPLINKVHPAIYDKAKEWLPKDNTSRRK